MHRVSYFSLPRPEPGDTACTNTSLQGLPVDQLDPFLSTHIIVAFARLKDNELVPSREADIKLYEDVVALKKVNPQLKVLLCVGGMSADPEGFSQLVKDPLTIEKFSKQAQQFVQQYGFDGLDVDWEFPAWPYFKKDRRERERFTDLLHQLFTVFKEQSSPPLLLTVAVAAPKNIVNRSYQVDQIARYVDFASMMGYDLHLFHPYFPFTGYNAPLCRRSVEKGCCAILNIAWTANNWVAKGMPREKLVVGIPTYGRTWKLLRAAWHTVGSPAVGEGMLGGDLTYPQACMFMAEGATSSFDQESKVPSAVRDRDWVTYEDLHSIRCKAEWVKNAGFGGVMTWNLNCDDWAGVCSAEKFALHKVIKDVICNSEAKKN